MVGIGATGGGGRVGAARGVTGGGGAATIAGAGGGNVGGGGGASAAGAGAAIGDGTFGRSLNFPGSFSAGVAIGAGGALVPASEEELGPLLKACAGGGSGTEFVAVTEGAAVASALGTYAG